MTEACCVDSQCLRRRGGEYEDGDELDADGGDGLPMPQACSLVIHGPLVKWAILESEEERTYELLVGDQRTESARGVGRRGR